MHYFLAPFPQLHSHPLLHSLSRLIREKRQTPATEAEEHQQSTCRCGERCSCNSLYKPTSESIQSKRQTLVFSFYLGNRLLGSGEITNIKANHLTPTYSSCSTLAECSTHLLSLIFMLSLFNNLNPHGNCIICYILLQFRDNVRLVWLSYV